MSFIEAELEFDQSNSTKEERELTVLGNMVYSPDSYNTIYKQVNEDDFSGVNKDLFKIIKQLYQEKGKTDFNEVAERGEQLGVIKQTPFLEANEDLQKISMMIMRGDDYSDPQESIDLLLKANRNIDQPQPTAPIPIRESICIKEDIRGVNIYNIQGHGGDSENLASKRDSSGTLAGRNGTENGTRQVPENPDESPLHKRIKEWVEETHGWWSSVELDQELGIKTEGDKDNRKHILQRLCDKGTMERHPQINRKYRYVNSNVERIDLANVTHKNLDIKLPFKVEDYVKIYPSNLIVVAGSPNAGKTAFMLNVIKLNLDNYANKIRYLCSEMGAEELRSRLDMFPMSDNDIGKFEAVKRNANFADAIVPDWINIVDFLEMSTDLWVVNDYLTAIQNKLTTGIGIVAIQKKEGARLGRGAEFGLEKPKLYLSLDGGALKIIKAKDWRDKTINPNGMVTKFKLVGGCKFIVTQPLKQESISPAQTSMFGGA